MASNKTDSAPWADESSSGMNIDTPGPIKSSIQNYGHVYGGKQGAGKRTSVEKNGSMAPKKK